MKKSMITIAVVLMSFVAVSGTRSFNRSMKQNLKELRADNENVNYVELGDNFTKIADANSNRFEALYYSAYSYILGSWQFDDLSKKTEVLSKAVDAIEKGLKLSPQNDELLVLKAFYYQAMIMTNPQKYGQSYSMKAGELLKKAQVINPSNPRAQFLLAQNTYYTPVEYGGGKDVALPLFKKATVYFNKQDISDYLSPIWGEQTNSKMVKKCIK